MCGFVGWVGSPAREEERSLIVDQMAKTIEHRGPDAYKKWVREQAGFGHQRLIVVDPKGGVQPMVRQSNGEEYILCYNGELYNTEDVRKLLRAKGWTFQGHSDTEVVLLSYIEWGEQCVQKFNGIFAFSVWEVNKQCLFIARDRLGVKPLFYNEQNGGLTFASEIKALLAHPDKDASISEQGILEVLTLGPSRTPGHGVFDGIHEVRPGFYATWSAGAFKEKRYWNVESREHKDTWEETVERVRGLFTDAVQRQLVSDVKLGTFLSGGVDSSAITSIAANYYKKENLGNLKTFSIDYKEQEKFFKSNAFQPDRDLTYIQLVQKEHKTKHFTLEASVEDLVSRLQRSVELRDLPGMADVDSSLLWFCEKIKNHVTVALSGECADEIFGGYPWFYRKEDRDRKGFPWIRSISERENLVREDIVQRFDLENYMLKRYQNSIGEAPLLDGETESASKHRQMLYLNMNWFMQTLLERKDRMSMGASLEVRVPFSDHRIVEYAYNIPWEMKHFGNQEKGLLRQALHGILPDKVLHRKKNPYPKTFHPDYTKAVTVWMKEILSQPNAPIFNLFDRKALEQLNESEGKAISTPWFGQLMTGPQLIAHLCQINYWLTVYRIKIN
ncbi:asparagine synthase (glutamine-hydrolyzing) [Halobacillus campisalis]|uniref:asparagine synthase (glutamine-hydrolyzing) n=1 Tax=Halobacillus campisalis TaxID=435909 RepID=A0ABW2K4U7_9BACI|nr:asparagine synthase (glutamine-hydrolyzing) [Halobacillus campisalis]